MQPPSDSLSHQQHKINEFVVNGRTIRAPPPTYSAATTPALASTGHATYADDGEDDGEEYCSTPPPITIDIDASVKIEGNWNTAPSANNTIAPIVVNIVNALKHAEVIGDREDLRRRIDFKINASATYKGNSNKPCRPVQLVKKEASVDSIALCSQNDSQLEDRKRRANSEPLEPTQFKRQHLQSSSLSANPNAISHVTLSSARDTTTGSPTTALPTSSFFNPPPEDQTYTNPPPLSEASSSNPPSPRPPPFSSLYFPPESELNRIKDRVTEADTNCLVAAAPAPSFEQTIEGDQIERARAETKAALPQDTKGESSSKSVDDGEPPPPYTEGSSPLESFTYVMAAAGGAASIITQVQQTGGPPVNTLGAGDVGPDEHITLDLRGTRFTLSRDELLTLPEFVLLSLFPNGLLPDGHMNPLHDGDVYPVDYDPASLQYMLDFFRTVAQSIPSATPSPTTSPDPDTIPIEPMQGSARDMLQDRAGIIVLREDLDFYVIPPKQEIEQPEMIEVKRAASKALLKQDGIFSGLRRSEEAGTTEQHLIEMLTAGGFDHDDRWGHRAGEPNKAVICSLALARLRTDIKGDMANNNSVGMAQKLLLFWRKPARRCWWEGIDLNDVEGVEGPLKVWIRRVWTLEMSVIGLR